MKKGLLVLIAVSAMLVWQCGMVLGDSDAGRGDVSLYAEGSLLTGNDLENAKAEEDWGSTVLGMDAAVGRCKVTVESFAKIQDGNNIKSTNTKVGLAIINNDFIRLDATVSYHDLGMDDPESVDCNGYLAGLDLRLDLSERMVLEAAIGYTNAGSWETSANDGDASILIYKFKCDLMPWRNFGFSIGYRSYSYRPESSSDSETRFTGMYGGFVWRFKNIHLYSSDRAPLQIWGK